MRQTIIALAMVLTASVAKAAPVYLLCTGTNTSFTVTPKSVEPGRAYNEDIVLSVDESAHKLTVSNEEFQTDTVAFKVSVMVLDDKITLDADRGGTKTKMQLNRFTGRVHLDVSTDVGNATSVGYEFFGDCKPVQKQF
jgi:hypothetical protein